jgi:hypothetical protein
MRSARQPPWAPPARAFLVLSSAARCRPRSLPVGWLPRGTRTQGCLWPRQHHYPGNRIAALAAGRAAPAARGRRGLCHRRTMANFSALAAARHAVLKQAGWDVEADGLFGAPPVTIIVGAEVHPTLIKSLACLALAASGWCGCRRTAGTNAAGGAAGHRRPDHRLCPGGNVNTGAFDPLPAIIGAAHAAGAWVHVDGALGCGRRLRRRAPTWRPASPRPIHVRRTRTSGSTSPTTAVWPLCATRNRCARQCR